MLLKKLVILTSLVLLFSGGLYAQPPCTVLGQNPETAFPVCGTSVFVQSTVPLCGGRLIPSPCFDPDSIVTDINPFWYKFSCFASGKLGFMIVPDSLDEDYDWQIFDVTGKDPRDVYTDLSMFVACNWSAEPGATGASVDSGGTSLVECQGFGVNKFSAMPDLVAGRDYLLLISHFETTNYGYRLSFGGGGSTAVITDTLPPHMFSAVPATCEGQQVVVKLNKRMRCSSLAIDGSDFSLMPPASVITGVVGVGCSSAFDMDSVLISFSTPLPVGNYQLVAQNGTDGNTLLDLCDNGIPVGETIAFTVLSPQPVPMDSLVNDLCRSDSLVLVFPDAIKCSSVAADGSDFFVNGTYPVTVAGASPLSCVNGLTRRIVVRFGSVMIQEGDFQVILQTGSDGNTLLSECDTPSVAGSAVPFSIKPKPEVSFGFPPSICLPGASVAFDNFSTISDGSENGFRYLWNFGDAPSGPNNISVLRNPTHLYTNTGPFDVRLQVTSNAGCIGDTTITLAVIHPQPVSDFGLSQPSVCLGNSITLTDSTNSMDGFTVEWHWNLGDNTLAASQNVNHIYSTAGSYNISLYTINNHGCKSATVIKPFTVYPYPVANAGPDRKILEGATITIEATAAGNSLRYLWTPSQFLSNDTHLNPKCIDPKFDVLYTLSVTSAGGCTSTDQVFIDVLRLPKIPNTFSPNNDGINDFWEIQYLDEYINNRTRVFTRTGQMVYESRGIYKPWNGTLNGKTLPIDTYYYIIEPGNGRENFTGYVTIIK